MGLSTRLHDVSGDSLLLLVVAAAASLLSHLRLLLLPPTPTPTTLSSSSIPISLSSLVAIADHIPSSSAVASSSSSTDCAVCLSAMAGGDRVRRLSCRHAFHAACIDGWLLLPPSALRCPLCRSPAARPDPDSDRRVAADLLACLSTF